MASRNMKNEEVDEPSLFVEDSPIHFGRRNRPATSARPAANATKKSLQPFGIEPKWKQLFDTLLQQCVVKEKAADSGFQCLKHLIATLKAHGDPNLGRICQLWIDRIDSILADKQASPVYIGLIGGTGAGKSTLINALLKIKGLLPVSSIKACTAVVVEVSYNHSDEKDALYRAEVEFVSRDDWRNELKILFLDLRAHYSTSGGVDGEEDVDRLNRIKDALATLKVVYPHLASIDDLRATSVLDLMEDEAVQPILGSTKTVQNEKQSIFAKAIRPYIATSESDKAKLDYWPLIKCVKLFVKVPFLKSGIVLVDLPGNMDRNSARGAIAMNYLKKLAAPLIVANAVRGIDDKNAHLILEDVMKTDLQMDGVYNAGNLCFILSQFDAPYDVSDYWKQNGHIRTTLRPEFDNVTGLEISLVERKKELAETQKSRERHKAFIEDLEAQIDQLKVQTGRGSKSVAQPQLKRKRGAIDDTLASKPPPTPSLASLRKKLSTLKETAGREADKVDSLDKSIKNLTSAVQSNKSQIYQACNNDRKAKATAAVRKDFENNLREMGKTDSKKALQVFCTASVVYLDYLMIQSMDSGKKTLGFPDQQSTEIPDLRDWLVEFTLPDREAKAQALLEDIERLITSMKPWIDDRSGDIKMSVLERAEREPQFGNRVEELAQNFAQLSTNTIETMERLATSGVCNKMPKVEHGAAKKCQETVTAWGKDLKWNTHRAVNQRRGEWTDSGKGRNHIWNDKLALDYKNQLVRHWNLIFHETFPEEMTSYVREQEKLIVEFAINTANLDAFPHHAMALELLKEQLLKTSNLASLQSQKISARVDKKIKDSHRLVPPAIKSFLEPMYSHCAAQGGTGHFAQNKTYHQTHMRGHGLEMHQKVSHVIRGALNELLKDLPGTFAISSAEILTQIRQEIAIFFEQNSSAGARTSPKRVISPAKVKLQNALDASVGSLAKAWNDNVDYEAEEVFDMTSLEFENDGRFNISEVLRDGDYNPDGSDDDDY